MTSAPALETKLERAVPSIIKATFTPDQIRLELVRDAFPWDLGRSLWIGSPILHQMGSLVKVWNFIALLTTVRVSDWDSRALIGRNCHVTSPIWRLIEWLAGPKIRIVG